MVVPRRVPPVPRLIGREALLLVVAAVVQVGAPLLIAAHRDDTGPVTVGGVALLVLAVAAIPVRLVAPVPALLAAFGATLAYVSLGDVMGPIWVALIVTFGHAVWTGHRRAALAVLGVGYVGFLGLGPLLGRTEWVGWGGTLALAAWLGVLYTGCELLRTRRDRAREAEIARADAVRARVADERLAIARELHDVVAHTMSLISLQAGVALHVDGSMAPATRDALEAIRSASKEALVELRSVLGVLRQVDEGAPLAPTRGLAGLDELVERARAAGVEVAVSLDADPDRLPRPVDLAAYRIVQEALTNVARHAEPPVAEVVVGVGDDGLVIAVRDEGSGRRRGEALPSGGNGIPGMRERAASVGGTLTAGPRPDRGFAVVARLPLAAP
jgi:signal transduction histidine kinase